MRFSANLGFLWSDRPLLARIEAAARAGFRAVEMHWPYDVPAREIGAVAHDFGVILLGLNTAPGCFAAGDRGLGAIVGGEAEFQAAVDQALEYCGAGGFTAVHAMAGNVGPGDRQRARDVFASNLRIAAGKAAAQGVKLLLEPLNPNDNPGYFYSTVGEAVSLIEELALANIQLQFDVYQVARGEGDVLVKLERYLDHIGNIQIAGVPDRAEPDRGEIAYATVFSALDRLGYDGWIGCEYRPHGDTDEGLNWMNRMGVR
jgi:hydroxypyruvate isomerase